MFRHDPMGRRALEAKRQTKRTIRDNRLSAEERAELRAHAAYEGSPHHKRNPVDFGLTPPSAPRADTTRCDEAGVLRRTDALRLFELAIERGIVSDSTAPDGLPKQLWAVDDQGRVFEAMYGGSVAGRYHGYPIRRSDPLFDQVSAQWSRT
jgi:hypothetical protein